MDETASTLTILRGFLLGISLAVLISLAMISILYGLFRVLQKYGYLRKLGYRINMKKIKKTLDGGVLIFFTFIFFCKKEKN